MCAKKHMNKLRVQQSYVWYETGDHTMIVKMYFMNYIPFTFDEIPSVAREDPEVIMEANKNKVITDEQLYKSSSYLTEELAMPLIYEMDLENPQDLPDSNAY